MNFDKLKTTAGLDVNAKRVLVRADLNVPVKDGKVSDITRLERLVPGLADLIGRGARAIVISHFGRPKDGPSPQYSLRPVAGALSKLLGRPVAFAEDCVGEPAERTVAALLPGHVAVLENLRFQAGEEKNDPLFAKRLAALGDIFVNDAFSAAHRAHASTDAIAHLLPAYAGPLLMEEIKALRSVLDNPERPTAAVIGGAKVSTKIPVLTNLIAKVDKLIIGGGMANTFFLAQGVNIGKSLAEPDFTGTALEIMHAAKARSCEVILPADVVVAPKFEAAREGRETMERTLRAHGLEPAGPAVANFLFAEVGDDARPLFEALLRQGAIVRPMGAFGAPGALRITVGTPDENAFFAEALASVRATA